MWFYTQISCPSSCQKTYHFKLPACQFSANKPTRTGIVYQSEKPFIPVHYPVLQFHLHVPLSALKASSYHLPPQFEFIKLNLLSKSRAFYRSFVRCGMWGMRNRTSRSIIMKRFISTHPDLPLHVSYHRHPCSIIRTRVLSPTHVSYH